MSEQDEAWGPWNEHDGSGSPVQVGVVVEVIGAYSGREICVNRCPPGITPPIIPGLQGGSSWHWTRKRVLGVSYGKPFCTLPRLDPIIRYRVQKGCGKRMVDEVLRSVPDVPTVVSPPVPQEVDA